MYKQPWNFQYIAQALSGLSKMNSSILGRIKVKYLWVLEDTLADVMPACKRSLLQLQEWRLLYVLDCLFDCKNQHEGQMLQDKGNRNT